MKLTEITKEQADQLDPMSVLTDLTHTRFYVMDEVKARKAVSDETRAKMRDAKLGKPKSAETKARMRAAKLGKTRPKTPWFQLCAGSQYRLWRQGSSRCPAGWTPEDAPQHIIAKRNHEHGREA